jgi:hypothetical protein
MKEAGKGQRGQRRQLHDVDGSCLWEIKAETEYSSTLNADEYNSTIFASI